MRGQGKFSVGKDKPFVEAAACTKCNGPLVRKEELFALRDGNRSVLEALGIFPRGFKKYPGLCCENCVILYPTKEWIDALGDRKNA